MKNGRELHNLPISKMSLKISNFYPKHSIFYWFFWEISIKRPTGIKSL